MPKNGGFRFLEHRADVYVHAYGRNLKEAFENAGRALFEVMTDTRRVEGTEMDEVEAEAYDKEGLLYEWLEKLLLKFELEQKVFTEFHVKSIERTPSGFKLKASAKGERYDPRRHESRTEVKAITYHGMEVHEEEGGAQVKVILDI